MSGKGAGGRPALAALRPHYDLIVIGGGITGAGVLREASRIGGGGAVSALLVERGDYASGTSSWSSKLIHGGLRYLKEGQWRMTLESVRERERLLRDAPGLVEPQPFLMPLYRGAKPGRTAARIGFAIADLMARRRTAHMLDPSAALAAEPMLATTNLQAAIAFRDGVVDDARLVLRLVFDAVGAGAEAINHVEAALDPHGAGAAVTLTDATTGERRAIGARMVVQATGVWGGAASGTPALRPLRGSHFVFSRAVLPLTRAVAWMHPRDGRPVFAHPWEGAVLVGTTDLDHPDPNLTATMSRAEADYLIEALRAQFPGRAWHAGAALAAFAGLRPIVLGAAGTNPADLDPSAMPRDSALWSRPGLVGITGGKLTTFRVTARQVLREAARQQPKLAPARGGSLFAPADTNERRISGRLGAEAARWIARLPAAQQAAIAGTPYRWGELLWSLRHEHVVRLDDLLLRRTRLGLVAPRGGVDLLPDLEPICRAELDWDAPRWAAEAARYAQLWNDRHAPPPEGPAP